MILILKHPQPLEAHERHGQQRGGHERDGETLETFRVVGEVEPLPDGGEDHDGEQKPHAGHCTVGHRLDEVEVIFDI